ncbi:FAD-dependent monooxygenase [Arthrobacter pigmenti]|uniref:FAD-dependent monooxygenase n=1 Tax=Arthrobacter pigmenti TaxID=271432 RepID=UPI003CC91B5F
MRVRRTSAPSLKTYVNGRTVLIGDAAHAMPPTTVQGAITSLQEVRPCPGKHLSNTLRPAPWG